MESSRPSVLAVQCFFNTTKEELNQDWLAENPQLIRPLCPLCMQASLKAADKTQGSHFAATASEEMCTRLRTRGVRCTATCHPGSTGDCHLAHLAMTLALAQSKALHFTSWADKSIDWILRRGLISGV